MPITCQLPGLTGKGKGVSYESIQNAQEGRELRGRFCVPANILWRQQPAPSRAVLAEAIQVFDWRQLFDRSLSILLALRLVGPRRNIVNRGRGMPRLLRIRRHGFSRHLESCHAV